MAELSNAWNCSMTATVRPLFPQLFTDCYTREEDKEKKYEFNKRLFGGTKYMMGGYKKKGPLFVVVLLSNNGMASPL